MLGMRFKSLGTPSFWVAFVLLVFVVLAAGRLFAHESGLQIRVGVYNANAHLLHRIQYYTDAHCEIVVYTDPMQMRLDVAAHKLECAYVFSDEQGSQGSQPITSLRSSFTVSAEVLDILMAAAYVEGLAGELGEQVLRPFVPGDLPTAEIIRQKTQDYLRDGALMETIYIETGEAQSIAQNAPYQRVFKGLVGLLALLLALLCGMSLGAIQPALAGRLKAAGKRASGYTLTGMAVVFVVTGLYVSVTLAAGQVLYPGAVTQTAEELTLAWAYAFALAGVSVALSGMAKADGAGLAVFIFVAAALLSGAFFDIREVWAAAAVARFAFPNHYYMAGRHGMLVIWGVAGVCVALLRRL
jgi:hypothetical protein